MREPFACNYGTNKHIYTFGDDGESLRCAPEGNVAYQFSGTARMAMINLTIVASVPDEDLPPVVYITGSQAKLDEMEDYVLIKDLRLHGTRVVLIDRKDRKSFPNSLNLESLRWSGPTMHPGKPMNRPCDHGRWGQLNSYAGAVDPDLFFTMPIAKAPLLMILQRKPISRLRRCTTISPPMT